MRRRELGTALAAMGILSAAFPSRGAATVPGRSQGIGTTDTIVLESRNLPGPVPVAVFTPPGYDPNGAPLPLVVMLHGGNGSEKDLLRFTDAIGTAIAAGRLAAMVIATPSAGRSLYMDYRDGSESWERFVVDDLLRGLRGRLNVSPERASTFIGGWSMGGLGALRIAFKHIGLFAAVAAVEPAIEPALFWNDVGPHVRFWRSEDTLKQIFGDPVDTRYWEDNNPATIAARDPERLREMAIYFEVGDQDMLYLYEGGEFLHRILFDARIAHEYRLVHGADHVGPSLAPRMIDALAFLSRQQASTGWIDASVLAAREAMNAQARAGGFATEEYRPGKMR